MIRPGVKRNGRALDDEWAKDLIEVVVDRQINLTGRADIRLYDRKLEHFGDVRIGDDIVVSATSAEGVSTVVFTGEVVTIEIDQVAPGADRELLITAFDLSHRLAHQQSVKPVMKSRAGDILRAVANDAGIRLAKTKPGELIEYYPGRGTGLEVLEGLCERYGWDWWVDAAGELSAGDDPAAGAATVDYAYLDELEQLSVRVAGFAPDKVSVPFWDPVNQKGAREPSGAAALTDPLVKKAAAPKWRSAYVVTDDERSTDAAEARARATGYQRRRLAETVVATGRLGFCDSRIDIGTKVKVSKTGDLTGPFTVTSLRHVFVSGESRTEFLTGRVRPAGLVDVAAGQCQASVPPLAVGTVTKVLPKPKEGPDLGPVAVVKFTQLDDSYETNEARLLSIGGSSDHGFFVAPSVGDEVLVGYERGDLRYPVVLGGLHSKNHPVGTIAKGDQVNTVRLRDGKGNTGNELLFTLDGEDGTVRLSRAGKNQDEVVMDKDRVKVTAVNELVLEVGQSSITMKKDGTIEIKGKDITVTASGNLKTKSTMNTEIEAGKATVKAQGQLGLEGGPQAELKSAGSTVVKGSIVQIN